MATTSGLPTGGIDTSAANSSADITFSGETGKTPIGVVDWRTKITVSEKVYASLTSEKVLFPLNAIQGIIFPHTPAIFIQHDAAYSSPQTVHSNYDQVAFENHNISGISVAGSFTANSAEEADYIRAVLHFLRSVTKMYFGQDVDPIAGTPPPVCRLNSHGNYAFSNVPVVIQSFNLELGSSPDYISTTDKKTMMPTSTMVNVVLKPAYSRTATSKRFGLSAFAKGELLGGKNQGGFI